MDCKLLHLAYLNFSFLPSKGFHFLFLYRIIIYVHCHCNIGVFYNLLNNLEICFTLTETCAEDMTEIVVATLQFGRSSGFLFRLYPSCVLYALIIWSSTLVTYPHFKWGFDINPSGIQYWFRQSRGSQLHPVLSASLRGSLITYLPSNFSFSSCS